MPHVTRALFDFAERFHPEALTLADRRLYGGLPFFTGHKMRAELHPGALRLALDIISGLRPDEHLLPGEKNSWLIWIRARSGDDVTK